MVEGPDGGWQPLETRLVMTQGLGFQGSLDLPLAQVLQHLDGRQTLAEATAAAAAEMGSAPTNCPISGERRRPRCGGSSSSASSNRNRPRPIRLGTRVIKVYATTWCGDCKMAKHVLDAQHVAYEYIDIDLAPEAAEIVQRLNGGFRSVPTILFPDGRVLVEPTRLELEAALVA